ncbi:MAG: NAD(P)-dependent oxidoreductase [Sneathiella sp.]|nr:NAD(P)-dependent oxidoreductase [Sneathiella sp.]
MGILNNTNVGFIGVDTIGKSMAKRIHEAGANTFAYNRSPAVRYEIARNGISLCQSPAEIADKIDSGVIILMLSDSDTIQAMLEGEDSLLSNLSADTLIIDMSKTTLDDTKKYAALTEARGAHWIDAPVIGDEDAVLNGELEISAGARDEDYDRALPILSCLGKSVNHVGGIGSGQSKALNKAH